MYNKQLLTEYIGLLSPKPELIEEAIKNNKRLVVSGILQRSDAGNQNGRIYPHEILMREATKYQQLIKERRALGELDHPDCMRGDAEVLTKDGWKKIKNISDTEEIYTLNGNTNNIELQKITEKISQKYNGYMYHINGKNIDTVVTPNHRFPIVNRKEEIYIEPIEKIYNNRAKYNKWFIPKVGNWKGIDNKVFIIEGVNNLERRSKKILKEEYSKDLVLDTKLWFSFMGLYLAEGGLGNKYQVNITQKKLPNIIKIRSLLNQLSSDIIWKESISKTGKITFYCNDARLYSYLEKLGNTDSKYIPFDIKQYDVKYLEELVEWFLLGDGSIIEYNGYINKYLASTSRKLIEDLQEVLFKIGIATTIKKENSKVVYRLKLQKSKAIWLDRRFLKIEKIDNYDDYVYCVKVPNEIFFVKENEKCFWSGNSSVVNLSNVSHNIVEMHWEGKNLIGTVEVLTTPTGNILKELFRNGIKVGISSRALGTTNEVNGFQEVQEDLELIAFDMVSNPSTHGAFMNPLNENIQKEVVNYPYMSINRIITDILVEMKRV